MSRQHVQRFLADHHLKLWACGLALLIITILVAATPPLAKNSLAANPPVAGGAMPAAAFSGYNEKGMAAVIRPVQASRPVHQSQSVPTVAVPAVTPAVQSAAVAPPAESSPTPGKVCRMSEEASNNCLGRCDSSTAADLPCASSE